LRITHLYTHISKKEVVNSTEYAFLIKEIAGLIAQPLKKFKILENQTNNH